MNTPSSNNSDDIKDKFDELLNCKSEQEETDHAAVMLSLQFISEFNKLMGKSVTKKDIADAIGTSRSYVTQVFNGSKLLNLQAIVKIQKALNAKASIKLSVDQVEVSIPKQKVNKKNKTVQIPDIQKNEKRINLKRENIIALNREKIKDRAKKNTLSITGVFLLIMSRKEKSAPLGEAERRAQKL